VSKPLDLPPDAVTAGAGAAWVLNGRLGTLYRVDPESRVVSERPLWQRSQKGEGAGVDVGAGSVWAAFGDSTLARVAPATLDYDAAASEAGGPTALVVAYGWLWVATSAEVQQFSLEEWDLGLPVDVATVCRPPGGIAAGDRAIWVACRDDDVVQRITAELNFHSVAPITVGDGPTAVAFGAGAVWVANTDGRTVSRIDPETSEVVETIEVGNAPAGIAVSGGLVWVSVQAPPTP
jgi:YVTN family beta-propeller protein